MAAAARSRTETLASGSFAVGLSHSQLSVSSKLNSIITINLQPKKNMLSSHACIFALRGRGRERERPVLAEISYCFGAQSPAQGNQHFVFINHSFNFH